MAVAVLVGVIVSKRDPLAAATVANAASIGVPKGTTAAVEVRDGVRVSDGVGVTEGVGVSVI